MIRYEKLKDDKRDGVGLLFSLVRSDGDIGLISETASQLRSIFVAVWSQSDGFSYRLSRGEFNEKSSRYPCRIVCCIN